MSRIDEKIRSAITEHRMLDSCNRVIVGLSGGADSTTLLHVLKKMLPGRVIAAHVNHRLRGEESERDEQFVRALCKDWNIPLFVERYDISSLAQERGETIEECGRRVRYDFFHRLAEDTNDRIATAHTLSDSAETILFHLTRGTGVRGLCGIPPVRGKIIRPLIGITRNEVEEYCRQNQLEFVEDSTNQDVSYARNRIRLEVLPQLEKLNPSVLEAMGRTARQLSEQEEAIQSLADRALHEAGGRGAYRLEVLNRYPKAVVLQAVLTLLRNRGEGDKITDQKLRTIYTGITSGQCGVSVSARTHVRCEQGLLLFCEEEKTQKTERIIPFAPEQTVCLCDKQVNIQRIFRQNCKNNENSFNYLFANALDYDTICCNAVWRTRRPGDEFRPSGRNLTKSVKKLLQEAHVPPSNRDSVVLLAEGSRVLWIEGFGPAEGCAVTEETKSAIQIVVEEETTHATGN